MDKTWKVWERKVAKFFGTQRNPLSGINSRHTGSDTLHEELFIEHKHKKKHSIVTLYEATKKLSKKEKKIPVVTISEKGKTGFWVLVHSSDLTAVANQRLKAKNG